MDERTPEAQRKQRLDYFRDYGRGDVLFNRTSNYDFERDAAEWRTTAAELRAAYEQGRQEAEREKATNPALFYLNALLTMMDSGGEWYGYDFDEPKWIVQQVIKHITEKT